MEKTQPDGRLLRDLGLLDSTSVVVGTIIGSGIFLVPGSIAQRLDSFVIVLAAWLVGGGLTLFGALSLAEMGAALPGAGGLYVYLRRAYGPGVGFMYGWGLLSMIHSGSLATLAVAFSLYLSRFAPLDTAGQKAVSIASVMLLTGVNCLGLRAGKTVQNLFTAAKLGGLAAMIVLLLVRGRAANLAAAAQASGAAWGEVWVPFGLSLIAVLWAYEGWHVVSFTAGEIRDPQRTLPRSLICGTIIILVVYVLANVAYYGVLTRDQLMRSNAVAAAAVGSVFGTAATGVISLLIVVSIFGAMNGMILTGPRVYYAMASDGLFFKIFARIHPRFHAPVPSILITGFWASALTMLGTFQELFTYVIFTAWIFYGLAVGGVIILRHKYPSLARPFLVPAYPWVPAAFCAAAAGITINTLLADPGHSLLGIGLILIGVPLYLVFRRNGSIPADSDAGLAQE